MRTFIMMLSLMMPAAGIIAESKTGTNSDCFRRIEKDARIADSLTVFIDDGTIIHGRRPIINSASSILFMKSVSNSPIENSATIPVAKIDRITYRKPGRARGVLALVGMAIGAVAGGAAGVALTPESKSSFIDLSRVWGGMIGGVIGGVFGAAGGSEIGKNMYTTVTLECDP